MNTFLVGETERILEAFNTEYPKVLITCETVISGKIHRKAIELNLDKITEDLIKLSLIGEIGKPFKDLLLSVIRTNKFKKQVVKP